MNSGCYGNDISKVLVSIQAIDLKNMTEIEIKIKILSFHTEELIYLMI